MPANRASAPGISPDSILSAKRIPVPSARRSWIGRRLAGTDQTLRRASRGIHLLPATRRSECARPTASADGARQQTPDLHPWLARGRAQGKDSTMRSEGVVPRELRRTRHWIDARRRDRRGSWMTRTLTSDAAEPLEAWRLENPRATRDRCRSRRRTAQQCPSRPPPGPPRWRRRRRGSPPAPAFSPRCTLRQRRKHPPCAACHRTAAADSAQRCQCRSVVSRATHHRGIDSAYHTQSISHVV
jgi:hypothetical protein